MIFTPNKFEYNPDNLPFYFVEDNKQICFNDSKHIFYTKIRTHANITFQHILPNGMTFGEMSIHLIRKD